MRHSLRSLKKNGREGINELTFFGKKRQRKKGATLASLTQKKADARVSKRKGSFFQVSPNEKGQLKSILINLVERRDVKTLGDLHEITGMDLKTIMRVTGLSEDEVVGIFVYKQGISWLDPHSKEARLFALGEIGGVLS